VKDRCNGTQRQNIITMSQESSLTLHQDMNFCLAKIIYRMLCEGRKKLNSMVASRDVEAERN